MIALIFEVAELSLERMWRRLSNWCQNKIITDIVFRIFIA